MKVGEYVRYQGEISKIVEIDNETFTKSGFRLDTFAEGMFQTLDCLENVKHNEDIIKLIKVGDYVNGSRVEKTYLKGYRPYIKLENRDKTKIFENRIYSKDIKSVLTKEQFKEMEYKVNE